MRARTPRLLALSLLGGCADSLGIGSSCTAAMTAVRLQEGTPLDSERVEEGNGDYRELWVYSNARYTFRWGASYDSCQVDGPVDFSRGPAGTPILIHDR